MEFSGSASGDQQGQAGAIAGFRLLVDGGEAGGVNLLFLVTAPEIAVGKQPLIVVPFDPLGDDKILPQTAHITPQIRRIEIVDDGIAHSGIHKIDFARFRSGHGG
jgi:hypothetical protein